MSSELELGPRALRAVAIVGGILVAAFSAFHGIDGLLTAVAGGLIGFGIGMKLPAIR